MTSLKFFFKHTFHYSVTTADVNENFLLKIGEITV